MLHGLVHVLVHRDESDLRDGLVLRDELHEHHEILHDEELHDVERHDELFHDVEPPNEEFQSVVLHDGNLHGVEHHDVVIQGEVLHSNMELHGDLRDKNKPLVPRNDAHLHDVRSQ